MMRAHIQAGLATAIGSVPHTDPRAAADFVLEHLPELPAVPTLPRRSPHEGMLAQAVVGVRGITVDDDGGLVVDHQRLDPMTQIVPDLGHPAFAGLQAFLDAAQGRTAPVKWQLTGPVTLGVALTRVGVSPARAFDVAIRASRVLLRAVHREVTARLPHCEQVVLLDEPGMSALLRADFPVPADAAIDLVSGALAAVEATTMAGIHCCGDGDWAAILATGPAILSLPVTAGVASVSGYLARFLEADGWIAWGAVPTDRPVAASADRYWRELSSLWCELVQGGCDAGRLRRQSMVTPACGLAMHSQEQAGNVLHLVREISERVAGQAVATRLSLGA